MIIVIVAGFSIRYSKFLLNRGSDINYDYTDENKNFLMYSKNALNNFLNDTLNQNSSIDKSDSILISKMKSLEDSVKSKDDLQQKKGKEKYLKEKSININTAGKDELVKLPGVGEAMADKIIKYRDVHMGFKKIDDIKKVKGIGKKKFEKMKPYITVE